MLIKKQKSFKKMLPGIIAVFLMIFGVTYFVFSIRKMDKQVFRNTVPILSSNIVIKEDGLEKDEKKVEQTIFDNPDFMSLQRYDIDTKFATGNPNIFK